MDLRKARTRTLIQLGGLIERSKLLEVLDLTVGDDLQKNPECFENVAVLMGALCNIRQNLYSDDAYAQKMIWSERGKKMLGAK